MVFLNFEFPCSWLRSHATSYQHVYVFFHHEIFISRVLCKATQTTIALFEYSTSSIESIISFLYKKKIFSINLILILSNQLYKSTMLRYLDAPNQQRDVLMQIQHIQRQTRTRNGGETLNNLIYCCYILIMHIIDKSFMKRITRAIFDDWMEQCSRR